MYPRADSVYSVSLLEVIAWLWKLETHAEQSFDNYILDGLTDGFRIIFAYGYAKCKSAKRNIQSATANSSVVDSYLRAEVEASRVFGLMNPGVSTVPVSTIGLVLEKHQRGRWRLMADFSSSRLFNINEGIAMDLCSVSFVYVDEAAQRL